MCKAQIQAEDTIDVAPLLAHSTTLHRTMYKPETNEEKRFVIEALDVRVILEDNENNNDNNEYATITCILREAIVPIFDCAYSRKANGYSIFDVLRCIIPPCSCRQCYLWHSNEQEQASRPFVVAKTKPYLHSQRCFGAL